MSKITNDGLIRSGAWCRQTPTHSDSTFLLRSLVNNNAWQLGRVHTELLKFVLRQSRRG